MSGKPTWVMTRRELISLEKRIARSENKINDLRALRKEIKDFLENRA